MTRIVLTCKIIIIDNELIGSIIKILCRKGDIRLKDKSFNLRVLFLLPQQCCRLDLLTQNTKHKTQKGMVIKMKLTSSFVETFVGNPSTSSNGKKLASKGSMQNCFITEDDTLIYGECVGSGKNPYRCSVDFINPAAPIARCSCPSRQIPCKHAAGLLHFHMNGGSFSKGDVPEDIEIKRGKIEKHTENKERKKAEIKLDEPPTKQKITSAKKRISQQLDGIKSAKNLIKSIIHTGIGTIDANMLKTIEDQVSELGNYYINGIQEAMSQLLICIKNDNSEFKESTAQLIFINELLKKARTHLETKLNDDNLTTILSTDSAIEQQIGYVWKLDELKAYNSYENKSELVQLSFYNYENTARHEYIDESYLLSLQSGKIYKKINYRPIKALKYVKSDDTVYDVITVDELYIYPGDINPRCRWDENTFRSFENADITKIKEHARDNFIDAAKIVKGQIKSPLADKNPIMLLSVADVQNGCLIDSHGNKQSLSDMGYIFDNTMELFNGISPELIKNSAVLVMYVNDIETGELTAKPLSIISDNGICRLLY